MRKRDTERRVQEEAHRKEEYRLYVLSLGQGTDPLSSLSTCTKLDTIPPQKGTCPAMMKRKYPTLKDRTDGSGRHLVGPGATVAEKRPPPAAAQPRRKKPFKNALTPPGSPQKRNEGDGGSGDI